MNLDLEGRLDSDTILDLDKLLKRHETSIHVHFSGGLFDRFASILNWYERNSGDATAIRKRMIEDTIVHFRSVRMLCESVGMADTHGEKAARLRGLIQLIDCSIQKLRDEQTDDITHNWPHFRWGAFSDYPYQRILEKFDELKKENEELKSQLSKQES